MIGEGLTDGGGTNAQEWALQDAPVERDWETASLESCYV